MFYHANVKLLILTYVFVFFIHMHTHYNNNNNNNNNNDNDNNNNSNNRKKRFLEDLCFQACTRFLVIVHMIIGPLFFPLNCTCVSHNFKHAKLECIR